MRIGNRNIGPGHPIYIVAEMSGNHRHDFEQAVALVHAAKRAGADAIKIQTYTADTITLDSDLPPFQIGTGIFQGRTLHDLYAEACTPWEWQPKLKNEAESLGLDCFSTPFDFSSVEFLEGMAVPAYKIASFELVDIPLIRRVAQTGRPLIFSTGMASLAEIGEAVSAAKEEGATEIALLKCTSAVPAPLEEMNLKAIPLLHAEFGTLTGLSDHSPGLVAPVLAVAMGASIIEKHLKLDDADDGPDASFSLSAVEFGQMVRAVRDAEKAIGNGEWKDVPSDASSRLYRKSLFVVRDIAEGELFTEANVASIRPADGLHPRHYREILGRRSRSSIPKGTALEWRFVG